MMSVMMISGSNLIGDWKSDIQNYHFPIMVEFGWASWKEPGSITIII